MKMATRGEQIWEAVSQSGNESDPAQAGARAKTADARLKGLGLPTKFSNSGVVPEAWAVRAWKAALPPDSDIRWG